MKKYEYYKDTNGYISLDKLNKLGQEGWKVVYIEYRYDKYQFVFMRELDELSDTKESSIY